MSIRAPYRPIVACGACLGLRQGENLALAEEDFDFGAGKVSIRRQLARVGGIWVFKLPKEGKARTVPLSRGLAAIVAAHIEAYPPRSYVLPWINEDGELAGEHTCRLMFCWHGDDPRTHGKHIKGNHYNDGVWKPALARAGIIQAAPEGEPASRYFTGTSNGNGTHILRHFFSTALQDAGVPLAGVMEFMGHSRKGRLRPVASGGTVTELKAAR